MTPPLCRDRIAEALEALGCSVPLTIRDETDSTNDEARAAGLEGAPHGAAFLAEHQRRGRGRQGRSWHSPRGESIYLSLVLRPELAADRLPPLALVAGLAVAEVVDGALGQAGVARIKWPNDVVVGGGKIAGVLVESSLSGTQAPLCIVGVGLNVFTRTFPADPSYGFAPTSLVLAGAEGLDRDRLAAALIASLRKRADAYAAEGLAPFLGALSSRDFLLGREVLSDELSGIAAGIDESGALLIDSAGRRHRVLSGAVRLV